MARREDGAIPKRGLLELSISTDDERADETLRALLTACEAAFPGRVRSYLLTGSYVEGDAIPASDLDLGVLFRSAVRDGERQRLFGLIRAIESRCAIRLNVVALDEARYLQNAPASALEAITIYGDDVRGELWSLGAPMLAFARPLNEAALTAQDEYSWPRACDRPRWFAYPDLAAPDGDTGAS